MAKMRRILVFIGLLCSASTVFAQYTPLADTTLRACGGFLTDSGERNFNYRANENILMRIYPDPSQGARVRLNFPGINLGTGDRLCFYDGRDTLAPLLKCIDATLGNRPFQVQSSAANLDSCITIVFRSDAQVQAAGWIASIECVQVCQNFEAAFLFSDPAVLAADTNTINLCPGDNLFVRARGLYPQNNLQYPQADTSSTFYWDFGNGVVKTGRSVDQTYTRPGAYTLKLRANDVRGCASTNVVEKKIRVAPAPRFSVDTSLLPEICAGDTLRILAGRSGTAGAALQVIPQRSSFQSEIIKGDNVFIPDNDGRKVESELSISGFFVNQILTDLSQLQSICINLEHSQLRDLSIALRCPNGQRVALQNFVSAAGRQVELGQSNPNDDAAPRPGRGYDFCWQSSAANNHWTDFVDSFNLDSLPIGTYRPFEALTPLLGCPLNGDWVLEVEDLNSSQNGYVFSWSLQFDPSIFPRQETFSPGIADLTWRFHPTILFQDDNSISVSPSDGGLASYRLIVQDSFACNFDTTLTLRVKPVNDPACGTCLLSFAALPDTTVCQGDSIRLSFTPRERLNQVLDFTSFPQYRFNAVQHAPGSPYASIIPVSRVAQSTLSDPRNQIESVCIDLNSDWDSDLNIFLRAPSGQILELSTGNGGSDDNYTSTCFSPRAGNPINSGTAPFTGEWQPEGSWNDLRGARIEGNWALLITDAFGTLPAEMNELLSWSISFRSVDSLTYQWTAASGLSCTTCASPMASPRSSSRVQVRAQSRYGCSYTDEFELRVRDTFPAPQVSCRQIGPRSLRFSWLPTVANNYQIRFAVNGRDSLLPIAISDTFFRVNNLRSGDVVRIQVQGLSRDSSNTCRSGIGTATCSIQPCSLAVNLRSTKNISCRTASDGAFEVELRGAVGASQFELRGPIGFIEPFRNDRLDFGDYQLVVRDEALCSDTLDFRIGQNDSLIVNLNPDRTISCRGDQNVTINSSISGGSAPFRYTWNNGLPTSNLSNIGAGRYTLSVSDANGCRGTRSIDITEPPALILAMLPQNVTCFGANDGRIAAMGMGGTGNLNYLWGDGNTNGSRTNLRAGNYCVTVTDANGCRVSDCRNINSPAQLKIDSIRLRQPSCSDRRDGQARVFASGGTGVLSYQWNDPQGQLSATANALAPGTYTVMLSDSNNCSVSQDITVVAPAALVLQINTQGVKCKGGNDGRISVNVRGGTQPYRYTWETVNQNDTTAAMLSAGSYGISITDRNNCTTEGRGIITEPANALTLSIDQTLQGCYSLKQNRARALPVGGSGGPFSYRWSDGSSAQEASALDSLRYSVTVTDATGCTQSSSIQLKDQPAMEPNTIISQPSCFGGSNGAIGINLIIGRPSADLSQYRFRWSNGETGAIIRGLRGDETYSVTITDPQGCTAVGTRTVRQPKAITFEIATDTLSCNGGNNATATVRNIVADTRNFTFQWDTRANNQRTQRATGLRAGIYTVTVTDEFGCFGSRATEVREPTPIQVLTQAFGPLCFGDSTGRASLSPSGGNPGYSYRWSNGATTAFIGNARGGTYRVTITDRKGCSVENAVNIPNPNRIQVNLKVSDPTCNGDLDGSIQTNPSGGKAPYLLSINRKDFRPTLTAIGLKAGSYTVDIKDANGCLSSEEVVIKERPPLEIDLAQTSYTIQLGDTLRLQAAAINNQGQVSYTWNEPYPGTLSCIKCASTTVRTQNGIEYKLLAVDEKGCEDDAIIKIFVRKQRIVLVPTGFSPNGDSNNDILLVHGQNGVKIKTFQVYDRWGEQVYLRENFDINDASTGWNGTYRGQALTPGIFIWFLEAVYPDGFTEIRRGQTTLLR
jgi:gliding motility-associated-like protein